MEELLWKHGRDILTSPGMERERSIPQHGYVNCFDHSVAVALLSVWIAARLGCIWICEAWSAGPCFTTIFSITGGCLIRRTGCTVFVMAGWRWRMRSGILDSTRWRRILSGGICFR